MVREAECPCEERPGSPHTRGDGPEQGRAQSLQDLFSPHAWGWSAQTNPILRYKMVLPTRVGMVRPLPTSARDDCSSPHTRGDGPKLNAFFVIERSFSPHAWGWSGSADLVGWQSVVLPTRVGMVRSGFPRRTRAHGSPHTRGDGPSAISDVARGSLFSPHAWGWSAIP